jgi:tetratricopeptide (TPR) repeat protein
MAGEEARLRAAGAQAPRSAGARQALGRYYLDHGRPFEAVWELCAARHLQPDDTATPLHLAVALTNSGLYAQAIEPLEALVARRPPARDGRVQLATLYLARMQPQKAQSVLEAAPGLAAWSDGQLTLGKVHEAAGQTAAAAAAYRRAVALAPASDEPPFRLAGLLLRQGDVAGARRVLTEARPARPSARLLTLLARTYLDHAGGAASFVPAEQALRAAREADPAYVPALVALGRLDQRQRRLKDALQAYAEALRLAPGDPAANQGAAELLESAGRPAEAHGVRARYFRAKGLPMRAIQEYEAMARFPDYRVAAVMEMSLILLETRHRERAVHVIKAALTQHPRDQALYERLVVLEMMWNHAQAQQCCEQWQRLEPLSVRPLWLLGRIRADQGDLAQATRLLQHVVDAEPENMDYSVTLAEVLLRHPDRAEELSARRLLERAVARPSADAKTYQDLGQTLEQPGQPEAARWAFLHSLDLDPDVSEPYVSLVRLARRLAQREEVDFWGPIVRTVEERLREALLLSRRTWETPDDPAGHRDLALHYLRNAELRKAESQLEEALRLRPGWPEAQRLLASVRRTREVL